MENKQEKSQEDMVKEAVEEAKKSAAEAEDATTDTTEVDVQDNSEETSEEAGAEADDKADKKTGKKLFGKKIENMGSADYLALPPCMRGVFVNVVNTFLEPYLSKIQSRTLIVWGQNDKETPLYMAKRFKRKIKNSSLMVLNGGHFVFLDCPLTFYKIVREFWEAK